MFPSPSNNFRPQIQGIAIAPSSLAERVPFLRKVYSLFTLGVVAASLGAFASMYLGTSSSRITLPLENGTAVVVPPLVNFFGQHWIIGGLLFFGSVFGASAVRHRPGVNVGALMGMGFVSGLVVAPAVWITQLMASQGRTLTASPVRDAFLLAVVGFVGLSAYALLSRRDFSFLRGFLSMGLWVVIGALILGWFVHSSAFTLAIASAGVLLFGGFVLYDTWRMARSPQADQDAVGAAISIYLSFLNLFLFLLTIFRGSRDA